MDQDRITVTKTIKVGLPNFGSADVQVSYASSAKEGETVDQAYERVKAYVDQRLEEELPKLYSVNLEGDLKDDRRQRRNDRDDRDGEKETKRDERKEEPSKRSGGLGGLSRLRSASARKEPPKDDPPAEAEQAEETEQRDVTPKDEKKSEPARETRASAKDEEKAEAAPTETEEKSSARSKLDEIKRKYNIAPQKPGDSGVANANLKR